MAKDTVWADYLNRPLTDDEKKWCHEWSLDWKVEENERLFGDAADYPREDVDLQKVLQQAGFKAPPPPPDPSPVGQKPLYTGPTVVEGENDTPVQPGDIGTRVALPRDHPLTGLIDESQDADAESFAQAEVVEEQGKWDGRAVRAEVNELNVEELKDNLRELDQPVGGNRDELRDRLVKALKAAHDAEQKA